MAPRKRFLIGVPESVRQRQGLSLPDVVARIAKDQLGRAGKAGIQVLECSEEEALQLAGQHAGLLIEEDQALEPLMPMPPMGFRIDEGRARELTLRIVDAESEKPLAGVRVYVMGANATYSGDSGKDGRAVVRVFEPTIEHVVVSPAANYWSRVLSGPLGAEPTTVALKKLDPKGASAWLREWLGPAAEVETAGAGVKVAVLDSGIAEHADLLVAGGINTLDGDAADFRSDAGGHGTHVAGVIAGRNAQSGMYGIAPQAELHSVRVLPNGSLSDLIDGIQWCIDNQIDVVCLGVGISHPSALLELVIATGVQQGLTFVAAAGNDGASLRYPAASEGVIAVTAFGCIGTFPPDSAHALRASEYLNPQSGLFVANFSNSGPQVSFIAPGVAIISTVPGGYAAWDGTSLACAYVAGLAAVVLSAQPQLQTGDARQATAVRETLAAAAIDLSLPAAIQGAGVPRADVALACATVRQQIAQALSSSQEQAQQQLEPLIADFERKQQEIRNLIDRVA